MHTKILESPQVLKAIDADVLKRIKEGIEESKARSAVENEIRRTVE